MATDDLAGLAARVRTLEDREEINLLFMEYRRCLDEKDFSGYAKLFAREGVWQADGLYAKGAEEIETLVDGMRGTLLTDEAGNDLHVVANPAIVIDGDRATARSAWIYLVRSESDDPSLCKVGHYDDELVREDGQWKFASRSAPMDMPNP
jgi:3-phenylpropionate/cinnamic acid dioxygenase small subunit